MSTTIDTYQRLAVPGVELAERIEVMSPLGRPIVVYTCDQKSQEWKDLHLGRPTASEFHRIVTPAKGELAEGRWTYIYELAVERLLNDPRADIGHLDNVQRGSLLESDAVKQYEFLRGVKTDPVGFITPAHGKWGVSPDRLWRGALGGVEIKCPKAETHLKYWNDQHRKTNAYRCQIQGAMMTTDLPVWDFVSYHPNLPEVSLRFERDDKFCDTLEKHLTQFCAELDNLCELIRAEGVTLPSIAPAANDIDGWRKIMDADPGAWAIG